MNLTIGSGKTVHLPSNPAGEFPKCEPTGSSRVGGFSAYRRTNAEATCKKCLRKP